MVYALLTQAFPVLLVTFYRIFEHALRFAPWLRHIWGAQPVAGLIRQDFRGDTFSSLKILEHRYVFAVTRDVLMARLSLEPWQHFDSKCCFSIQVSEEFLQQFRPLAYVLQVAPGH